MGIPKFYRWISERYPCLSEKIREYQIPEFDNLYLDMNGIIHSCSHPNDEDIHLRIPEKNIFSDIFQYIDFLFKMIKPRRTFFMAVDGVAPRAKMNQQRGRRFRSAKLAEDQEAEAIRKGEVLPNEERFDSNCITPGTEFMARLHEQLQFFVKVKVSTDPLWQRKGLTIIVSGHDVPGEGEHKIMDYIRHIRSQPNYDPDTRHCLYGLDADLIMLGLSTHELRFSLLREEVKFTRPRKKRDNKRKPGLRNYDPSKQVQFIQAGAVVITSSANGSISYSAAVQTAVVEPQCAAVDIHPDPSAPPTHFPREEEGAKGSYRAPLPEKTTFLLLHLSLLRDYIDEEFQSLRTALEGHVTIKYDIEKVIDDWILLSILVGNDFVPHLPMLHIVRGAFPMLYNTYMALLPSLDGYLNENGILNLRRLETFLQKLSEFDLEVFRETYDDMKYMESKTGRKIVLGEKMFDSDRSRSDPVGIARDPDMIRMFESDVALSGGSEEESDEITSSDLKALIARTELEVAKDSCNATASEFHVPKGYFDPEDSSDFQLEFLQYKRNYYMDKMGMDVVTKDSIRSMAEEYVRAIQWVLLYYYKGVSSWGWFYPHHYGPFCSDIHHLDTFNMQFVKGQPFKPFEQLLGVLPSQSGKLLPKCFYELMINEESPILDFYPKEFENDLNGKRNDWEAVVLIPFIDESRLLTAMEQKMKLTDEETHRNSRGLMHFYTFSPKDGPEIRSLNDLFLPLAVSHFNERSTVEVTYNKNLLPKGLHPKAKRDKIYQGFPTLKSIKHTSKLDKGDVKVFDFVTREDSLMIDLIPDATPQPAGALAQKLLGKTVWVNWPHLTSAVVTGVSDSKERLVLYYRHGPQGAVPVIVKDERYDPRQHKNHAEILTERHLKYKGIHLGEVDVLLWAKTMEGRRISSGHQGQIRVERQWSRNELPFALGTTLHSQHVQETFMMERNLPSTFLELFAGGDLVVCVGGKHFGSIGTVESINWRFGQVIVTFERSGTEEANLGCSLDNGLLKSREYYTSAEVSSKFKIPGLAIAKLTGTVYLTAPASNASAGGNKGSPSKGRGRKKNNSESLIDSPEEKSWRENIGLNLKFNKRNLEVRGYTRKNENQWVYSRKAVDVLLEYSSKFPEVIGFFSGNESHGAEYRDSFAAEEFFPRETQNRLDALLEWIEEKGLRHLPRVPINSKVLDDEDVLTVWKHVQEHKTKVLKVKTRVAILPHDLHKPGLNRGCVGPGENGVEFEVLDRVVCVDPSGPMPLGQRGTVVGIQNPADEERQEEEAFRSTSATVLKTLIVLPDPTYVPPPKPQTSSPMVKSNNKEDEIRFALISMLKIKVEKELMPADAPKLLSFYPFQLLNISQYQRNNPHAVVKQEQHLPLPSVIPALLQTQAHGQVKVLQRIPSTQNPNPQIGIQNQVRNLPNPQIQNQAQIPPNPQTHNQVQLPRNPQIQNQAQIPRNLQIQIQPRNLPNPQIQIQPRNQPNPQIRNQAHNSPNPQIQNQAQNFPHTQVQNQAQNPQTVIQNHKVRSPKVKNEQPKNPTTETKTPNLATENRQVQNPSAENKSAPLRSPPAENKSVPSRNPPAENKSAPLRNPPAENKLAPLRNPSAENKPLWSPAATDNKEIRKPPNSPTPIQNQNGNQAVKKPITPRRMAANFGQPPPPRPIRQ